MAVGYLAVVHRDMPEGFVLGEHEEDEAEHLSIDLVLREVEFLQGTIALHTFTYEFQVFFARRYITQAQLFQAPVFIKVVLDVKEAVALSKRVVV